MNEVITFNTATNDFYVGSHFKPSGYGLAELIKDIPFPVALEIGCDVGDTSDFLLKSHPKLFLTGVDPYSDYLDWNGNNLVNRESVCKNTLNRLQKYQDRFTLIRETSDVAHVDLVDEHFDMIFIDGIHTYEQVIKDCQNFYSKVKPGGIFAGHDYNVIPGVGKAVREFAATIGKEILTTECDVWYWIK